jgi:MFS family permease
MLDVQLFKNKNFVRYWLSAWITSLGDTVFIIALTWMLVESTGSPLIVGTYLFVIGATKLVFILFGGVIVDRWDTRKLLMTTNITRTLLLILLYLSSLGGIPPLWMFYVIGVLFGIVDSIAEPAAISCRTRIVDKAFYTQSMGLLMIAGQASAVIGPMIGAGLVYLTGAASAFLVNSAAFALSALLLMTVNFRPQEVGDKKDARSVIGELKDGLHYFVTAPILLTMAMFAFFANAAVGATLITVPFFSKELGLGVEGYGLMNMGIGAGSVLGAMIFSLFVIRRPAPWMTLLTCFVQGFFILLLSFTDQLWLIVVLLALMGFQETAVNVIAPSVNHTIIPSKVFGRVISVMILVMSGSVPLSQALAGWFMEWGWSSQSIFLAGGLIEMIAAGLVFFLLVVRASHRTTVV